MLSAPTPPPPTQHPLTDAAYTQRLSPGRVLCMGRSVTDSRWGVRARRGSVLNETTPNADGGLVPDRVLKVFQPDTGVFQPGN